MKCPVCGSDIPEGYWRCPNCKKSINVQTESSIKHNKPQIGNDIIVTFYALAILAFLYMIYNNSIAVGMFSFCLLFIAYKFHFPTLKSEILATVVLPKMEFLKAIQQIVNAILLFSLMLVILLFYSSVTGFEVWQNRGFNCVGFSIYHILKKFVFIGIIIVPIFEELFNRAFLFSQIEKVRGFKFAVVYSVVFTIITHTYYFSSDVISVHNLLCALYYAAFAATQCFVYYKTKNLKYCILLHIIINLLLSMYTYTEFCLDKI